MRAEGSGPDLGSIELVERPERAEEKGSLVEEVEDRIFEVSLSRSMCFRLFKQITLHQRALSSFRYCDKLRF